MAHQEQRWHNDKDNDGTTTTTRSRSTRAHIQCCCHDVAKRRSPETLAHQEPTLAHQEQRWHTKNNDGTPRTMLQQRCGAVRHLWAYSPLFGIRRCSAVAAVIHSPISIRRYPLTFLPSTSLCNYLGGFVPQVVAHKLNECFIHVDAAGVVVRVWSLGPCRA